MTTISLRNLYTTQLFTVETLLDFTIPTAINTPVVVTVTNTAMFDIGGYVYVRNTLGTKYGTFKITALTADTLSLSLDSLEHKSGSGTVDAGAKITPSAKPTTGGGGTGSGTGLTTVYSTDLTVATAAFNEYLLNGTTTVNLHAGVNGDRVALKDYSLNAATVNITVNPNGVETVEKQSQLILSNDGVAVEFVFYNGDWSMVNAVIFADYLYDGGGSLTLTSQQLATIGYTGVYQ